MNKPLSFPSLLELLVDFQQAWAKADHTLHTVTLSKPIPDGDASSATEAAVYVYTFRAYFEAETSFK